MEGWDPNTKSTLTQIPLLSTKAGPRDGAAWTQRLKEEYRGLIAYTSMNKSNDNDWFRISAANAEGTRWTGKCWYVHNLLKYEFDLQFDIPVTYPATAPEIELPQLDGKTHKVQFYYLIAPLSLVYSSIPQILILLLGIGKFYNYRCIEEGRFVSLCISSLCGQRTGMMPSHHIALFPPL